MDKVNTELIGPVFGKREHPIPIEIQTGRQFPISPPLVVLYFLTTLLGWLESKIMIAPMPWSPACQRFEDNSVVA
jgi:hypothetical protein